MPVTYWGITSDDIKSKLADTLHVSAAGLDTRWNSIVDDAMDNAYRDIFSRLTTNQYTAAQINSWDYRVSFFVDQTLFWCLVKGAGLGGYDDRDTNKLDHRKELEGEQYKIGLLINGVLQAPGVIAAGTGSVVAGCLPLNTGDVSAISTFRTQRDRRRVTEFGYGDEFGVSDWG